MNDITQDGCAGYEAPGKRGGLTKLLYAVVFLAVGSHWYERFAFVYLYHLAHTRQIRTWLVLDEWSTPSWVLFVLIQMVVVLYAYRPLRAIWSPGPGTKLKQSPILREVGLGAGAGLGLFLLNLPFIGASERGTSFAEFLSNHFFSVASLLVCLLLTLGFPLATEMVFRGVVFKTILENTSLPAAVLASSVLFAYVWPLFNFVSIFLLGIATALLYHRRQSLLPGIVANGVFSACGAAFLVYRAVLRS